MMGLCADHTITTAAQRPIEDQDESPRRFYLEPPGVCLCSPPEHQSFYCQGFKFLQPISMHQICTGVSKWQAQGRGSTSPKH